MGDSSPVPARSTDLEKALVALGRAIRSARREMGMTEGDLALRADVHETYVSFLESGRRNPTWGVIRRISMALGLPLPELARRAEDLEREDEATERPDARRL